MATYRDGNVRKATPNTITAMQRSATGRQCPKCRRKSAVKRHEDELGSGSYCRYEDCDYETWTMFPWDGE